MKEGLVFVKENNTLEVKIHDVPVPQPGPDQVLIQVVVSGTNQKDWKFPQWMPQVNGTNTGDDIAGLVHAVGQNVTEFKKGDRVAALHEMNALYGSYAEYAISECHTTFHIPAKVSFEGAATVPLTAMTAVIALFSELSVPPVAWIRCEKTKQKVRGGVLVYGATGAVGQFAVKLLKKTGVHPIICVAGKGKDQVEKQLDKSKGDVVVDYRNGEEALVQGIRKAIPQGASLRYAFDTVSDKGSYNYILKVLDQGEGSALAVTLPVPQDQIPRSVRLCSVAVAAAHTDRREVAFAWARLFGLGLKEGWLTPHPHEVVPGGLNGVQAALTNMKDGKASGIKYVLRIADAR
jgi:NADPH2:quinone reductase